MTFKTLLAASATALTFVPPAAAQDSWVEPPTITQHCKLTGECDYIPQDQYGAGQGSVFGNPELDARLDDALGHVFNCLFMGGSCEKKQYPPLNN